MSNFENNYLKISSRERLINIKDNYIYVIKQRHVMRAVRLRDNSASEQFSDASFEKRLKDLS